jgi:predicted dehydrogenase
MVNFNSAIVVFGAGSIGERHIKILLKLGYNNINVYRKRNLPLRSVDSSEINIFTDLNYIDELKPLAAFITSPTALHLEQALFCVSKGIHILVEKPLSDSISGLAELRRLAQENNTLVQIAYMLRFHPAFVRIKAIISHSKYGKLLYFHTHWGEYLPDWHPWEDYRKSYAALKSLGGGAALTLSHDIDITSWLLGEQMVDFKALGNTLQVLEVETESAADFLCKYASGTTGHIHLNFFQKVPQRSYQFVFEKATVQYNYLKNQLTIETADERNVVDFHGFERDNMFRDQAISFFDTINAAKDNSAVTGRYLTESENIIKMCTAIQD